jgi:type IV pilus assembly protein PilX
MFFSLRFPVSRRDQQGVALVVALVLLIVVTLVGLAAIRGTTLQQRMTANFYDRQIGFQAAEAALAAGAAQIQNGGTALPNVRVCDASSAAMVVGGCTANPFMNPNLLAAHVVTVQSGFFQAGSAAAMQPQYVLEVLGPGPGGNDVEGGCLPGTYGCNSDTSGGTASTFYRVTARSGDPASVLVGDRSVVTLQATYRQ